MEPLPLKPSDNCLILFAAENLTRWPIIRATKSQKSDAAIKLFRFEIVRQFGRPRIVLSDNGPAFTAAAWIRALREAGKNPKTVAAYSLQLNGQAGLMVQTVKVVVRRMPMASDDSRDKI